MYCKDFHICISAPLINDFHGTFEIPFCKSFLKVKLNGVRKTY